VAADVKAGEIHNNSQFSMHNSQLRLPAAHGWVNAELRMQNAE
jgi:hypothetical protein